VKEYLEIIISVAATALPLLAAIIAFVIKMRKNAKCGRQERNLRLWAEYAQDAVGYVEVLKGKANGELNGDTKKEFAMNRVEAACIKNGVPFERDKISEIMENIIALTKRVNGRDKDKIAIATTQNVLPLTASN
jgi:hypothetical protein